MPKLVTLLLWLRGLLHRLPPDDEFSCSELDRESVDGPLQLPYRMAKMM